MRHLEKLKQPSAFWQFIVLGTLTFTVVGYFLTTFVEPLLTNSILSQQRLNASIYASRLAAEFLVAEDFREPAKVGESREHFEKFAEIADSF